MTEPSACRATTPRDPHSTTVADAIRISNGVEGWRGATGWISFSNGLSVRREQGRWRFSGGLSCVQVGTDRGACR